MRGRQRSFTLLLVLSCLALAGALIAPLALLSGSEALQRTSAAWELKHKLAGDSLIQMLPQLLSSAAVRRELADGHGKQLELSVGDVTIKAILHDDSGKIPLQQLARSGEIAIGMLASAAGASGTRLRADVRGAQCFEDVLEQAGDREIFGTIEQPGWIAEATPLAGRVNAGTASTAVLEALLSDVGRGLGTKLAAARERGRWETVEELLARVELTQPQRAAALERLAAESIRFSLLIETRIESDVRTRYVIVHDETPPIVVIDWEASP